MDEQTALMNDEHVVTGNAPGPDPAGFPPPRGAGPRPPWYRLPVFRDTSDDIAGGVVSGLCQTYGFDRRTTRIALLLASFVLPVLVLVYVFAWILLPDDRASAQPLADVVTDRRRVPLYVALGLVIVAGGLGSIGSWFVFGDFPWGIGLIALGVLLWVAPSLRGGRRPSGTVLAPPSAASAQGSNVGGYPLPAAANDANDANVTNVTSVSDATDATDATDADTPVVDPLTGEVTTVLPTTTVGASGYSGYSGYGSYGSDGRLLVPPAAPSTPGRRRIPIGSITLLAVIGFIAVVSAGDAIGWWDVPVLGVVVASVIALATGLAVSTVVNGAWFFMPLVLVLAAAAGALVISEPSLDGGVGERTTRPSTVVDAERVHDLAMGELTLDLVDVPLDPTDPVKVNAEVGIGRLHVIVPAGAELVIVGEVGMGHVVIGDREVFAGVRNDDRRTVAAIGDTLGTIELDLRVGVGEIDVDRDVFGVIAPLDPIDPADVLVAP